jgi:hypothetical protein
MARTATRKGAARSDGAAPPPDRAGRRRRSRDLVKSPAAVEPAKPQPSGPNPADLPPAPAVPPVAGLDDDDSDSAIRRIRESIAARLSRDSTWSAWAATGIAVIAVAGIVAIAVASTVGDLGADRPGATPVISAAPDSLAGQVGGPGAVVFEETFDELPMDSSLPSTWRVEGGGGASIVALPTSVDRSVRIRSSPEGDRASACRPTGVDATSILGLGVDVVVGGRADAAVPLLALEHDGTRVVVIGMGPSGDLVQLQPPPDAVVTAPPDLAGEPDAWRRLELRLDPNESLVEWQAHDVSGTQVAAGRSTLERGAWADVLCLFSPEGAPSSWIAVDDLVVRG